jgi:hypothetical protein
VDALAPLVVFASILTDEPAGIATFRKCEPFAVCTTSSGSASTWSAVESADAAPSSVRYELRMLERATDAATDAAMGVTGCAVGEPGLGKVGSGDGAASTVALTWTDDCAEAAAAGIERRTAARMTRIQIRRWGNRAHIRRRNHLFRAAGMPRLHPSGGNS